MNNDLKLKMKVLSSDSINMKVKDNENLDMDINVGGKEVDPIFRESPAYTITYEDINDWNNKSDFSGNYNDLKNKPIIPSKTSQLQNDSGYINKSVSNLENYTLSSNLANVATTGLYNDLLEKPTIPTDTSDLTNNAGFITNNTSDLANYTLSTNLSEVALTGQYNDLLNAPTLANVATSGNYNDLINKPTLAVVASTGDYDDLIDKPTIPTKTSDLNNDSGFITKSVNDLTNYTLSSALSSVATSGNYNDLSNTPTIPTASTLNVYSTSEVVIGTWLNKPLYRKVVDFGALPNATQKSVSTGLTNVKYVNIYGYASDGTYYWSLNTPRPIPGNQYGIGCYINNNSITIECGTDKSSNSAYVVLEYTKNSD